ncbi:MAG: ECF-type sigma factor [Bacteroidota bacterium]
MDPNNNDQDLSLGNIFPEVYDQLKLLAHNQLFKERKDHTFNTTALVHEAYEKMEPQAGVYRNKSQFFALAAQAMRRILVDYARKKKSEKRGGVRFKITYGDHNMPMETSGDELLIIHEALQRLSKLSLRQAQVVEYWFFGGFNQEEISKILDVSLPTVRRDWRLARAWLSREIKKEIAI